MLSQDVERYVTSKRIVGYKFTYPAYSLKRFADYAMAHGDQFIRVERVLAWVTAETPSATRRSRLVARVRRFALDMQAEDPRHEVPPRDCFGRAKYVRKSPYIYTADEIERILCVAHQMPQEGIIAPLTLATLLGLLASTGLRISEAMALQCADLTDDGLLIRKSKNNRTRLVPLHETTRAALEKYLSERARQPVYTQAMFVSRKGQGLQHAVVWCAFMRLLARTGIRPMSSSTGPRLHDLRHTFAVRSLEQCQNDRRAVAQHMIALSTYLGHTNIADTYWYLEATAPLLRSIAEAGEAMHRGGDV